jgi:hypothetical protein
MKQIQIEGCIFAHLNFILSAKPQGAQQAHLHQTKHEQYWAW